MNFGKVSKLKNAVIVFTMLVFAAVVVLEGVAVGDEQSNVPEPVLEISKTMTSGETTVPTSTKEYWELEIVVTYNGQDDIEKVKVEDELPEGIEFVSATPSKGKVDEDDGKIKWEIGTMKPGEVVTLTMEIKAEFTAESEYSLNEGATVKGEIDDETKITAGPTDPIIVYAVTTTTTTVTTTTTTTTVTTTTTTTTLPPGEQPVLEISKTMTSGKTTVIAGVEEHWTLEIVVTYNGQTDLSGAVVKDKIPKKITLDGTTASKGSVTTKTKKDATKLEWTIGAMSPGDTETLAMDISATFSKAGEYKLNKGAKVKAEIIGEEIKAKTKQIIVYAKGEHKKGKGGHKRGGMGGMWR